MEQANGSRATLRDHEAAELLSVSTSTLRSWRSQRRGPDYSRLGRRIVYTIESLQRFLRENTVEPGRS